MKVEQVEQTIVMTEAQKRRFADAPSRLSGDEEMLVTLASIAAENAPGLLEAMSGQLEHADLSAYASSAHAVKGLLSTFETNHPVSDIQAAIDAARRGDQKATRALHADLQSPVRNLIAEIVAVTRLSA